MAVYVDDLSQYPGQRVLWSHLWADSVEELQQFAQAIGLKAAWFQDRPGFPHYDVQRRLRARAIVWGAEERSLRDWVISRRQHSEAGVKEDVTRNTIKMPSKEAIDQHD